MARRPADIAASHLDVAIRWHDVLSDEQSTSLANATQAFDHGCRLALAWAVKVRLDAPPSLSYTDFARDIGVTPSALSHWWQTGEIGYAARRKILKHKRMGGIEISPDVEARFGYRYAVAWVREIVVKGLVLPKKAIAPLGHEEFEFLYWGHRVDATGVDGWVSAYDGIPEVLRESFSHCGLKWFARLMDENHQAYVLTMLELQEDDESF